MCPTATDAPFRSRHFLPTEGAHDAKKCPTAAVSEPPPPPLQVMDTVGASVLAMSLLRWSVRPAATYDCRRPASLRMSLFITEGAEGREEKKEGREATRSEGKSLEESASCALMRQRLSA